MLPRSQPGKLKTLGLALAFVALSLAFKLAPWFALSFLDERSLARSMIAGGVALALTVAMTVFFLRRLRGYEHPALVLVPRRSWRDAELALAGAAAGALLFGIVFALALATGGIHVEWLGSRPAPLALTLLVLLADKIVDVSWQELTFRGWPFSACVRAFGPHPVAIGLGTIFGLVHLFNANWTFAAIASVALAGFLISYAMIAFQNLLVCVGLHVGWNYTQSVLTSSRFGKVAWHPSPWLSGGRYGLEASAPGIAVTAAAALLSSAIAVAKERRRSAPVS